MLSRALAGVAGGYALAQMAPIALVAPWGLARVDAVLVAMQISFVIYAIAMVWAFAAHSAARAWTGVVLALTASCAVVWLVR